MVPVLRFLNSRTKIWVMWMRPMTGISSAQQSQVIRLTVGGEHDVDVRVGDV